MHMWTTYVDVYEEYIYFQLFKDERVLFSKEIKICVFISKNVVYLFCGFLCVSLKNRLLRV